jgi:outer membrane protein
MKLRLAATAALALLSGSPARPQTAAPATPSPAAANPAPAGTLSLEECIARALNRNFDLRIQRLTSQQAVDSLEIAKADFDTAIQVTGSTSTSQQPGVVSSIDGVTSNGLRQESQDLRAGITQRISTGATVSASTSIDRSESNSRNLFLNPAYNGDFSLSVRQPLLRGAGSETNRAAIRRAEIGVERANLDLRLSVLEVVRGVETAYYNLVFSREQRTVRTLSLRLAEQLLQENRARRETGVATDLDVLQAEVGVANAQRNLLLADQAVRDREDGLLQLIGEFEAAQSVGEVSFAKDAVGPVSFDRSYKLARDNQPELASAAAAIRQLEIDARSARQNRLPSLEVGAALGLNSREPTFGDAASATWDGDGYAWQVDFALRMPWGLRAENARYRQALGSVAREEARLQRLDQDLLVEVRAAVRAVDTNLESARISSLATRLSERQYELERARFAAGLSTSRRVLEAQDDLEAARVSELQSQVNLRVAFANLNRLEGSSLERYRITLDPVR